jgi:hypothetical protein
MSSTDEIQDPLTHSQYSQQEDEEQPQAPPEVEGLQPTSSVYNLSAYDLDQSQEPEEKLQYCCEMDKSFSMLDKSVFITELDPALDDLRQQQRPVIIIEDV